MTAENKEKKRQQKKQTRKMKVESFAVLCYNKQRICSVSCHFEAIHRREIRIIYAKRNGFLTSFEMTDGATE